MEKLNSDWLTDGLIDFEYKKYTLLAYFQEVRKSFNKVELYPVLSELIQHYNNLNKLKEEKDFIESRFPKQANGLDVSKLKILYKQMLHDDEIMKELEGIVEFALPMFKGTVEEGKEIYEFVETQCEVTPIGLLPLYTDEGYFFLGNTTSEVTVHRYQMMKFESPDQKYRGIHTTLIDKINKGIGETFENLKLSLVKRFVDLPNPATYLIQSKMLFPYKPTLVPIAKRLLIKHISTT
jgi:hypothetical protein